MTKFALLNGQLVQYGAKIVNRCNVFLNSKGAILGLGYVPDLEDDEFTQVDLNGGSIYPFVSNIAFNATDSLASLKDVSCPFAWSTDASPLNTLDEVNALAKQMGGSVVVMPNLLTEGQYLNSLYDFFRLGYQTFYQTLEMVDSESLMEAFQELSVLKGSVLLDATSFGLDDFVDGLINCLHAAPGVRVVLKGLQSFEQLSRLKEMSMDGFSVVLNSDYFVTWFKKDYNYMIGCIESGLISGVYSRKGVSSLLKVLKQECQLDTITTAKVLGETYCQLMSPEFLDWSVQDKPSIVLDSSPELMVFRDGMLVN